MMPATMPACSWSPPRVAETLLTSETSKASGRAPYLSTLASSVALFWLKLPEIWAWPPGIASLTDGAEIDCPSSTMAKRFCGSVLVEMVRVAFSKAVAPAELNCRSTTQLTLFCGIPAEAPVSWLPSISVGPRRYFSVPSWLQAMMPWSGVSVTGVPQVKSANAVVQASGGCQSSALSGGVPLPSGLLQASPTGFGGAVGKAGIGRLLPDGLAAGA